MRGAEPCAGANVTLNTAFDYSSPSGRTIGGIAKHQKQRSDTNAWARTPFQRVLESSSIPKQAKEALKKEYAKLNPVELKREIIRLQDKLDTLARSKNRPKQEKRHVNLEYIFK